MQVWFVFIKRWESNFDLIFFRYLHHRRWIWTVQFNQSPILMPEASVTRILTTLLRVRQLEGFTFAHSKVCLCLYNEFVRCPSPIWFANFSTNFSQFEQLKKKTNFQRLGCDRFFGRTHTPLTSRCRCAPTPVRTSYIRWSHALFVNNIFSTIFHHFLRCSKTGMDVQKQE